MSSINTPLELKTILDQNNSQNVLLDVRSQAEFESGHIPDAVNINVSNMPHFLAEISKLDKTKNYLVNCQSGGRSSMACMIMAGQGFKASNVVGGISAWIAAGYETV